MAKLNDKIALVTGGARGIGRAIVTRYIQEGARVAIADLTIGQAEEVAAEFGDRAFAVEVNVAKLPSIDRMIADVVSHWGAIDILVNNAAIFDLAPIVEVTEASYDKVFGVNVKGLFFTLQAVARHMIARGKGGKIINMASQAGRRGEALVSVYCASKAAVISSISSSTRSTSTPLRRASSTRRCGTMSTRSSPDMKAASPARRNGWSAKPCLTGAWARPRTIPAPPFSSPPPTPITLWRRRSMSTAAIG
jgi:NAD(P)-dependent dehydrogenase (short-subunit alcohol dehydrogenase family)